MLFSCAVRPVSRLVLVSAAGVGGAVGSSVGGHKNQTCVESRENPKDQKRRRKEMGGKRRGRARTHDHDGGLHALHLERSYVKLLLFKVLCCREIGVWRCDEAAHFC